MKDWALSHAPFNSSNFFPQSRYRKQNSWSHPKHGCLLVTSTTTWSTMIRHQNLDVRDAAAALRPDTTSRPLSDRIPSPETRPRCMTPSWMTDDRRTPTGRRPQWRSQPEVEGRGLRRPNCRQRRNLSGATRSLRLDHRSKADQGNLITAAFTPQPYKKFIM